MGGPRIDGAEALELVDPSCEQFLVGTGGLVPFPVGTDALGRPRYERRRIDVNPALLQEIARATGGTYAVATDRASLEQGLQAVLDRMEKSRILDAAGASRTTELFPRLLAPAFWLAAIALVLLATRWRPFP